MSKAYNSGLPDHSNTTLTRFSLKDTFKDAVEKFNLQILEDRVDGCTILGFFPKNTFTSKEKLIKEVEETLEVKKRLPDYNYQIAITYLMDDLGVPFTIDMTPINKDKELEKASLEAKEHTEIAIAVRQLLRDEQDAIASYIEKANSLGELGYEDVAKVLLDIAEEEVVHTGELQALLSRYDLEEAPSVADGFEEVADTLDSEDALVEEFPLLTLSSEEIEAKYTKYLEDFKTLSPTDFRKAYSHLRCKRLTNTKEPVGKERFEHILTSSFQHAKVEKRLPALNNKLQELEVVMDRDEDGDTLFYVINPEASLEEFLSVLEWLEDRGAELTPETTDIDHTQLAKDNPDLVELGFGGGDTYLLIYQWKDINMPKTLTPVKEW